MIALILSHELDGHIAPVAQILRARGCEVLRVNLADVPLQVSLSSSLTPAGWRGTLTYQSQCFDLAEIKAIWWRRPTSAVPPATYTPAQGAFWLRENERGFTSLLLPPLDSLFPFWVSSPDAIHRAARKPFQLAAAQALGLDVPRTILTNDPQEARAFYHQCNGKVICKAIARGVLDPEGQWQPGQERFIYTSAVTPEHLEHIDRVSSMMHAFQERINKALDLRVIVLGTQVFAIEIHAPVYGPASLDWRRDYAQLSYAVHQLPQNIEQKLVQLVRFFGLQFSSIDLILSKEGTYVYIEQNPNGQFLWPAQATSLPLAEAMANLLMYPEEFAL